MRAGNIILILLASALVCEATRLAAAEIPSAEDASHWVERLKSDEFDVRAEAAGKLAALGETARPALEIALKGGDVETRTAAAWLLARLTHSNSARFMTFDRNGKPAENVEGMLTIYDNSTLYQVIKYPNSPLQLGAGGLAEIPNLKPGIGTLSISWQKCWIAGEPSNYGPGNSSMVTYLSGGTTPFLFTITRGGSVKVTVRDPDGKPVKEADVSLYPAAIFNEEWLDNHSEYQPMRPTGSGTTNADGAAVIDGVNDGVYVCAIAGIKSPSVAGPTIRVREGETTLVPPIAVVPNQFGKFTATLSGVLDPLAMDPEQAQLIQFVRANGKLPEKTQPDEPTKLEIAQGKQPGALKNLKLAVDDDFIFEGPDADAKTRRAIVERARNARYRRPVVIDTDEKGRLTLEGLRPGKHRLHIKTDIFAPVTLNVTIPAAGTLDAGVLALDAGGSIIFKAQQYDGRPVTDLTVFAIAEDESAASDIPPEVQNYIRGLGTWDEARNYILYPRQISGRQNYDTSDREKYTLKNIEPGKYTMLVSRQSGYRATQVFLVCGVNIEAGKTINGPELKFNNPPSASHVNDGIYIKGRVAGPAEDSMIRSTVYYQNNGGTTGTNLNSDGNFQVHIGGMGPGGVIHVKVPGYKQAEFDCAAPGVDLNNIVIKLERLSYGSLRLKIVDEEGRPLSGASVDPAPFTSNNYVYYYNRRTTTLKKNSDAHGEVSFSGLSIGKRRIAITKDGYYLSDAVRVTIQSDDESTATVMMRKGLALSGKLSAPAGTALNQAVVSARRSSDGVVFNGTVNEAGEFSIAGLMPEKFSLSADAPLYATRAEREIELISEAKSEINLELVPKGGFAAQFDKRFAGRPVTLSEKMDTVKPAAKSVGRVFSSRVCYGVIDADGKAEFWNVKPGTYHVTISPPSRLYENIPGYESDRFLRRVECSRQSEPFEIKAPRTFSELNLADAVSIPIADTEASATAKFVFRKSAGETSGTRSPYVQTTSYLIIRGERCTGNCVAQTTRARYASSGSVVGKIQVIGTLPAFLAPVSSNGLTLIEGLAPGKYTISSYSILYDSMRGTQDQSEETAVATFEVKAGERKELGPIVVEPSKTIAHSSSTRRGGNSDAEPAPDEDQEPAFEP